MRHTHASLLTKNGVDDGVVRDRLRHTDAGFTRRGYQHLFDEQRSAAALGLMNLPNGGYRLTLSANTLLRDLAIFVDRLDPDATISDQFMTLLPGESFTFKIYSQKDLTKEDLMAAPVFQCANRFGVSTKEEKATALESVVTK